MTDQRVSNEMAAGRPPGDGSAGKAEQAKEVAHHAAERAGDVAGDAKAQAKEVAQDAAQHARQLVGQARGHLDAEAQQRSRQAAGALRQFVGQLGALTAGRPEESGPLAGYASQGQQSLARLADRLDEGPSAVLDDLRRFARRQPVVFLAAAGGIGFVVGRLVRGAREASSGGDAQGAYYSASGLHPQLPPPVAIPEESTLVPPTTAAVSPTVSSEGLAP
jgi:ElaB/YqjD/DUF883 family membrane-anchored ribosome-binding protein